MNPRSNFNHKKHIFTVFIILSTCSTILIWKYKKHFLYLITHKTHKQLSLYHFYLVYIVYSIYFTFITSFYLQSLIRNLVLDNHAMDLGTQSKTLLCRIARVREREDTSKSIPREFDINPRVILVGKNLLWLRHSALGVPTWRHPRESTTSTRIFCVIFVQL